ncbi:hypothetical protein [Methylobacterium soli]|uniref:DUF3551 domain-containing protein n=1 Tax=Methylobacterium soli TaxID=553447 RepID=A0A6L3T1K6_9HYPH|nr:hypothetical protein [Methylobacterium soli]KAB1079674.1 hypothetical protein F6X53_10365 [Methylobacterium soli]GJE43269.1 hypothetical protein AEGHOMDF_2448 [Methylobacterium soli]
MRGFWLALGMLLLPGVASAECRCVCVRGEARSICSQQTDLPGLCQVICPAPLEQRLEPQSLGPYGGSQTGAGGGGIEFNAAPASSGRNMPAAPNPAGAPMPR